MREASRATKGWRGSEGVALNDQLGGRPCEHTCVAPLFTRARCSHLSRYLVKPTLTYLDGAVTTTLTHYKTSRGCLDTIITSKLASADDSIDAALPKIWDHVPLKGKLAIDVPLTCDHATVVPTVLFPEDSPTRMIAECHETLTDYVDRKMPRKPASTTKTSAYSLGYPNIVLPAVGVPYFGNSRKAPH